MRDAVPKLTRLQRPSKYVDRGAGSRLPVELGRGNSARVLPFVSQRTTAPSESSQTRRPAAVRSRVNSIGVNWDNLVGCQSLRNLGVSSLYTIAGADGWYGFCGGLELVADREYVG